MQINSKYILSIGLVSILLGCGGSSTVSTASTEEEQSSTLQPQEVTAAEQSSQESVTLKGVAVDDLIINGVVKVYTATTPKRLLTEGRTDAERGTYTLNIDYDGVVILDVTPDEQTKMKNPETGEISPCEPDLLLQSAAALSPEVEEVEVNISPLTNLVVAQMTTKGASKEALESAQDNIGQIFGFDPLGDSPLENEAYGKTVSAIRDLADEKGVSIVEVIEEINQDTIDGRSGDDGEIAQELARVMEEHGVMNTFTQNDGVVIPEENLPVEETPQEEEDETTEDPVVTPPPVTTTTTSTLSTDITVSKQFFDDLRTQTMSVLDYDNTGTDGFLDTESQELGEGLENMALNLDLVADYSMGIVDLIAEAIEEGTTSKSINMDEESVAQVERTLEVARTEDSKVWNYTIEENTSRVYCGVVTLPDANISSITASNFTALEAKFEGSLPLAYMDSLDRVGDQNVTFDLKVDKTSVGADVLLSQLSIENGVDSISVENLKGRLEYDHDTSTDETTMKDVKLDTITLKATLENYALEGKLDLSYVSNSSIASRGFESESTNYETEVRGKIKCVGDHNEEINSNGDISGVLIYIDQSSIEHQLDLQSWGDFYGRFEGNLQNLESGEEIYENVYDSNLSTYLGLNFDTVSVSSESCDNLVIEEFYIGVSSDRNQTNIGVHLSCLENNGTLTAVTDASGTFTDTTGVAHTLSTTSSDEYFNLLTEYDGLTESVPLNEGSKHFDMQNGDSFDRIAISNVNSECQNPFVNYLNIFFGSNNPMDDTPYTYLDGAILCDDNSTYPSQATVVYTDPSGVEYTLTYLPNDKGRFETPDGAILGNVEGLPITEGEKHYHTVGQVLELPSFFRVENSSCSVTTLSEYAIRLDEDWDDNIYNSGVVPKNLTFNGDIKNTTTNGEVDGTLNVEWKNAAEMNLTEESEDKAELDVTLQGHIKMPNRPEMILNMGYENVNDSRTDLSLSYQYDTTVLNGIASLDAEMDNGTVEFTSTNGIKLVVKLEDGETIYGEASPVSRNGRKIGELQERAGVPVISYLDGTFESLP